MFIFDQLEFSEFQQNGEFFTIVMHVQQMLLAGLLPFFGMCQEL